MKQKLLNSYRPSGIITLFTISVLALSSLLAQAVDVVYVTSYIGSTVTACPTVCNIAGSYSGFGSTAISAAPGIPTRNKTVYYYSDTLSWSIQPTLNVPGAIYKIEVAHTAATTSPDIVMTATVNPADGTLSSSCANSPVFDAAHGGNSWNLLGYITNAPGVTQPVITFTYVSGAAGPASSQNRIYNDAYQFTEVSSCSGVAGDVKVSSPVAVDQTNVTVLNVDAAATNISVFSDGVLIGQRTSGIVAGTNSVVTTALTLGAEIKAQQTKNGCVSSIAGAGAITGGGANPVVKALLTCWQNAAYAGPIGTNSAIPVTGVYYALKGSGLPNGSQNAPGGGEILNPGQCWQTVTFDHSLDSAVRMDNGLSPAPYNPFCSLDSLMFVITDPIADGINGDSGPYDIYVDQIKNGDVVIEDFESYAEGSTNRFSAPNQQAVYPNPSVTYLQGPNSSLISTNNAFDGTKSLRIRFQWNGTSSARWARIQANATAGKNFPQLDTTKPITIRYLVLPVGETTNKLHLVSVPVNQTKTTNETATFSVTAAGEAPFTYQWNFEGNPIDGATTSSYSKSNVQLIDSGVYSVTVTGADGLGCSSSTSAKLTVTEFVPPPVIAFSLSGTNLTLNWEGSFNLQSKTNLSQANWNNVGITTAPYTTAVTNAATFYRLQNP